MLVAALSSSTMIPVAVGVSGASDSKRAIADNGTRKVHVSCNRVRFEVLIV